MATSTDFPLEGLTGRPIDYEDATWILTSAFIVFTMQSGFGLIESGMVTIKNETNIMVKNAIDIIFSGLSFWLFGFGLSFGVDEGTNAFTGVGYFLTEVPIDKGEVYAMYFFQMALASTATTIVSGSMAERTNLKAYMLYSFVSTLSTCFPTHWIWGKKGLLKELGVIDIAGCSGVHLVGGAAGLAAAVMLGPRLGRFDDNKKRLQPCSMTNVLLGTFMLWWGWLGFNCGSTFGITGEKWKLAARAAVVTLNGSIGGGIVAIAYSYLQDAETLDVPTFVTGIRGGLVSVTGICALARPWEGILIGLFGGMFACLLSDAMIKLKIDDPVNCVATHAGAAVWGMIAVALFAEQEENEGFSEEKGLFKGGSWRLLGVQLLACLVTAAWAVVTTVIQLFLIEKTIGIRLTREEELQGCDFVEHGIGEETGDEKKGDEAPQLESSSAPNRLVSAQRRNVTEREQSQGKDQASKNSSQNRIFSSTDIGKDNEGSRNSNELPSMCSMESDIEELLRQESCYPMIKQKGTLDKCVQVICEHGVLIEL